MTTTDQDRAVEAIASEHGGARVLPVDGTGPDVLACGWVDDEHGGHRVSEWVYIFASGNVYSALRSECADALEASDRHAARIPAEQRCYVEASA